MVKISNKKARSYRDCMTPDQALHRCRPGWRSSSPEEEAKKRNDELLEATGEEVTLLTRRAKGDDVIDRVLPPVINNYVSALPLNLMFLFDSSLSEGLRPEYDGRYSNNMSGFLSDLENADRFWCVSGNRPPVAKDYLKPLIIAKRPFPYRVNFFFVGNRTQFTNISIKLFTKLLSDNVVWEYSRGNNVWFPVPIVAAESTPGVSTLQESGRMVFDPAFLASWKKDWVNNEEAYWVRARIDENTEGEASALIIVTENVVQSAVIWNDGDDPFYFPNDECVTLRVDGKIYNRVYDLKQLDFSDESFVLMRTDQLDQQCGLTINDCPEWGLKPFDTCETNPLDRIDNIGTDQLKDTNRLREIAFLYSQLMRPRRKGANDAVVAVFTKNLRLENRTITATYTNLCPCTAYGRFQAIRDNQQPDDSGCITCYGTQFLDGYQRYVNPAQTNGKILMSFPPAPVDMPLEEHGLGKSQELTTARMSWTPRIYPWDIVVRYDEFGQEVCRYIVMTRTDSIGRRGVLLHQEMVLQALDRDKIEYRIDVPDLPLAPSQAQVLQSLGLIVPDDPNLDSCEEKRLEKGKKDCRPERDRRFE